MKQVDKIFLLIVILLTSFIVSSKASYALEKEVCSDRYVTLINPVRGRGLWRDKTLTPIKEQYQAIKENNFSATWLLQFDILNDKDLLNEIKNLDQHQELGVFLEVSEKLAADSRVIYPINKPWFDPGIVFLSGYTQSERKKLIDKLFKKFKETFSVYPKSVGAWWIDSYSLDYMKRKYNINSALIVADQKTTDNYGIWGQWWGLPYYPSKANILTPANDLETKQDVVIIQWAQRDPLRAYGETLNESNFSLQANDYLRKGLDTRYFKEIIDVYLDCSLRVGQVTVGLETGIESVGNIAEYRKQLEVLKKYPNLKAIAVSEFSKVYSKIYPELTQQGEVNLEDSKWIMTTKSRQNEKFDDEITYNNKISFTDYFVADKSNFLDRVLKEDSGQSADQKFMPWYFLAISLFGIYAIFKRKFKIWIYALIFLFASYGLILKSHYLYGWKIFYGPILNHLEFWQVLLTCTLFISFFTFYNWNKLDKKLKDFLVIFLPLSYGIDVVIYALRYSYISGYHYFGVAIDSLRFIGISFSKNLDLWLVNLDFPSYQASALLRLDSNKFQDDLLFYMVLNPVLHILVSLFIFWLFLKLPIILQKGVFVVFIILFCLYIVGLINTDPRVVLTNT